MLLHACAFDGLGKVLELHCDVFVCLPVYNTLALDVSRRCARLDPSVHLREDEVEALGGVCLIIEDEFAAEVVKFEQLDTNFVAVGDEDWLRIVRI